MARDDPVPGSFHVGVKSDVGLHRQRQEDAFGLGRDVPASTIAAKGLLCVVADGVGGELGGDIASKLAVSVITQKYYEDPAHTPGERLQRAIRVANGRIYEQAQATGQQGMSTTVVCAVVLPGEFVIGHVGDSRAYRLHDSLLVQLTRDHSWVQEQLTQGILSEEAARTHPFRNMLTRSLGTSPDVVVEVTPFDPLQPGDALLLCTDGIHGQVAIDEIRRTMRDMGPEDASVRLVELANLAGGRDNATALIIRAPAREPVPVPPAPEPLPEPPAQVQEVAPDAEVAVRLRDLEQKLVQAQLAADDAEDAHRSAAQQIQALQAENQALQARLAAVSQAPVTHPDPHKQAAVADTPEPVRQPEDAQPRRAPAEVPAQPVTPSWDELESVRTELVEVETELRTRAAELQAAREESATLQRERDDLAGQLQSATGALQEAEQRQQALEARAGQAGALITQVADLTRARAALEDAARRKVTEQEERIDDLARRLLEAHRRLEKQQKEITALEQQLRAARADNRDRLLKLAVRTASRTVADGRQMRFTVNKENHYVDWRRLEGEAGYLGNCYLEVYTTYRKLPTAFLLTLKDRDDQNIDQIRLISDKSKEDPDGKGVRGVVPQAGMTFSLGDSALSLPIKVLKSVFDEEAEGTFTFTALWLELQPDPAARENERSE